MPIEPNPNAQDAASRPSRRPTARWSFLRDRRSVLLAVTCGVGFSLGAHLAVLRWERQQGRQRFELAALEALHNVRTDLAYALDSLEAVAAFVRSSREIEPSEFRHYTTRLLKRRAVVGLGIAERRGQGYPVIHFEPQAQFPDMLSSDLMSRGRVREAFPAAADGLQVLAHPELAGVPEVGEVYLALRHADQGEAGGAAAPTAPGRDLVIFGVLDMAEALVGAIPSAGPPLRIRLRPHASTPPRPLRSRADRFLFTQAVTGTEFTLVASAPAGPWTAHLEWVRWAVLLLGLVITSLVAAYVSAAGARRRLLEEQKERSDQTFEGAFEAATHGMALVGTDGRWLRVNPALCAMLGYAAEELEAMDFQAVTHPDDLSMDLSALARLLRGEIATYRSEKRYVHKDGHAVWIDLSVASVWNSDGSVAHFVCQIVDRTRAREAEAKLVQAQKMESIGQLTGGIAHDFNNLLMVVLGNLELAQRRVGSDARLTTLLRTAREAGERGALLTKQLLTFARRQPLKPKTVIVGAELTALDRLIRRTIGEGVALDFDCAPDLWPVRVDPVQLEAAVLNLVVNARDAIKAEGRISIRACNQVADVSYALMERMEAGDYVLISVSDDGAGIPAEHLEHVVEPFFTTKEVGKGTGLGLSMVHGFMKQSGGHLKIYSEEGIGTVVKLYLPRVPLDKTAEPATSTPDVIVPARPGAKVLVVEDQAHVRDLTVSFLEELGYAVVEAESGRSALRLLEVHDDVDLILSDVVMPGDLDGFELARAVRDRFPAIPVVLASGFAGPWSGGEAATGDDILAKPYTLQSLGERLRRVLDGRDGASSGEAALS